MKWAKRLSLLIVLFFLLLIPLGYVTYLAANYRRIPDHQALTPDGEAQRLSLRAGQSYTIATANIGFGAYDAAYSFFMDGGLHSRALSQQAVWENTQGSVDALLGCRADIVLLQEVDLDADRSWHVNQYSMFREAMPGMQGVCAVNYDSSYLFYPPLDPIGKSKSSIATFSRYAVEESTRRSLPIMEDLSKLFDLDRCFSVCRIPVATGGYLSVYNVHLSAYLDDPSVRRTQILTLMSAMEDDRARGGYVICGGDFNHDLTGDSADKFGFETGAMSWSHPFPEEMLPEGFTVRADDTVPSCRNANEPYQPGHTYVLTVDGFLTSDNVRVESVRTLDSGFAHSDHAPVVLEFSLQAA